MLLTMASFDCHKAFIAHTSINSLFQKVGNVIQFGSGATSELIGGSGIGDDVSDLIMQRGSGPECDMACELISEKSYVSPERYHEFAWAASCR